MTIWRVSGRAQPSVNAHLHRADNHPHCGRHSRKEPELLGGLMRNCEIIYESRSSHHQQSAATCQAASAQNTHIAYFYLFFIFNYNMKCGSGNKIESFFTFFFSATPPRQSPAAPARSVRGWAFRLPVLPWRRSWTARRRSRQQRPRHRRWRRRVGDR